MQTREQAIERINFLLQVNHDAPLGHLEKITDRIVLDVNIDERWVDYVFDIPLTAQNSINTTHGGFLAAMADAGMTIGARGILGRNGLVTATLDISVNAIKAMYVGDHIRMRCKLVHVGKRTILASAEYYRGDELCTMVTSNYMLLPETHVKFTDWSLEG